MNQPAIKPLSQFVYILIGQRVVILPRRVPSPKLHQGGKTSQFILPPTNKK